MGWDGFWYWGKAGKNINDIIWISDSEMSDHKAPFLIKGVGAEQKLQAGQLFQIYYIIQPNRRKSDKGGRA
jgi:hypothetical protein